MKILIGADPELFLIDGAGTLVSAIEKIGGSKEFPRPLGNKKGFMVQEDNVAAEFNIPPAASEKAFVDSIHWAVKQVETELVPLSLKPAVLASALFPEEALKDPRALIFGCEPDYNAWKSSSLKLKRNPRPRASDPRLRSCGGHIHVGFPKNKLNGIHLIRLMDLYLGVPSVMLDEDDQRRKLYGKAGAFRVKDYGVEYRVLSNFWLKSRDMTKWAYQQTMRAVEHAQVLNTDKKFAKFMESHDLMDNIQKCINRGNLRISHNLISHYALTA